MSIYNEHPRGFTTNEQGDEVGFCTESYSASDVFATFVKKIVGKSDMMSFFLTKELLNIILVVLRLITLLVLHLISL